MNARKKSVPTVFLNAVPEAWINGEPDLSCRGFVTGQGVSRLRCVGPRQRPRVPIVNAFVFVFPSNITKNKKQTNIKGTTKRDADEKPHVHEKQASGSRDADRWQRPERNNEGTTAQHPATWLRCQNNFFQDQMLVKALEKAAVRLSEIICNLAATASTKQRNEAAIVSCW